MKPAKIEKPKKDQKPEDLRQIVRFAETNLDGAKPVRQAIRKIKGISFMFSNAVSKVYEHSDKKLGELTESELNKLEDIILNPQKHGVPSWLYNRKFDPITGETSHLTASRLDIRKRMDIDDMKKIRSYKGIRHGLGLPVRGQRTRSSFRTNKSVGVRKKKVTPKK